MAGVPRSAKGSKHMDPIGLKACCSIDVKIVMRVFVVVFLVGFSCTALPRTLQLIQKILYGLRWLS
jgi:hypothetical protein